MTIYLEQLFGLSGKVVLVTGASSGIGANTARAFARAGAQVVLTARREDKLQQVKKQIVDAGGQAEVFALDISQRDSVDQVVSEIVSDLGQIDVLLNNAGIANPQRFLDMEEAAWQQVIDINQTGVWRMAQAVAKVMIQQDRGGSIINLASVLGIAVQRQQTNYSAAKAAVIQLTKSMALELGRKGIRVNAVAPGYFKTEINTDFLESEKGQSYLASLFPQRAGQLQELEGVMLLLASEAGSYINGEVITVDGGSLLSGL